MHPEVLDFLRVVKMTNPLSFHGKRVLEVGSYDVNGSPREFFTDCVYVGIDCRKGPGVDWVGLAHEYDNPVKFDTVVSTEVLEHDPHLEKTLANAARLHRKGGLLVVTCAGPARAEHGTRRTEDAGGTWGPDADFYENVSEGRLRSLLSDYYLPLNTVSARGGQDTYAWGIRD